MSKEIMQPCDRLKLLMKESGVSISGLAKDLSCSDEAIKNYRRSGIPVDIGILIAKRFDVSLDWLYGISKYRKNADTIANIITSLEKVFHITTRYNKLAEEAYTALLIDKTFYDFLNEIHTLSYITDQSKMLDDWKMSAKKEVYLRYQEYFRKLVDSVEFDESTPIEISDSDSISIVDLLVYSAKE